MTVIITVVCVAPLQGNLLKNAPSRTSIKQCGLKAREEYSRVAHWRQTQRKWESIPSRRTSHREGTAFIHSLIQAISIAPFEVHYYSEALPTQHGYCVGVSRRSATGNCE